MECNLHRSSHCLITPYNIVIPMTNSPKQCQAPNFLAIPPLAPFAPSCFLAEQQPSSFNIRWRTRPLGFIQALTLFLSSRIFIGNICSKRPDSSRRGFMTARATSSFLLPGSGISKMHSNIPFLQLLNEMATWRVLAT